MATFKFTVYRTARRYGKNRSTIYRILRRGASDEA